MFILSDGILGEYSLELNGVLVLGTRTQDGLKGVFEVTTFCQVQFTVKLYA